MEMNNSQVVVATKEQERNTLKKIKKMVEALGPDSYLATAFKGCFEDAEGNIEDDFAFSYYDRWESARDKVAALEAKVKELEDKLAESEKDYEAAHAAAHEISEAKDAEIASIKARIMTPDDLTDCISLVKVEVEKHKESAADAAMKIVEFADDPTGQEFTQAVRAHRIAESAMKYYVALQERLASASPDAE